MILNMNKGEAPSINGLPYTCGSFTLDNDCTDNYDVPVTLSFVPKTILLWTYDVAAGNAAARVSGAQLSVDMGYFMSCAVITSGNTANRLGLGYSVATYVVSGESEFIRFFGQSTPLRAGWEYQWVAIGGEP